MAHPSRPSVLFLIADDWSPLAACYGNNVIRTPHVDAFARQATVFQHAFCTSPSCAVSRASILTGHYSHTHGQYGHCHGIHGFRTHEHMHSTPALLKRAGYATAIIGKNHVKPDHVYPFDVRVAPGARNPVAQAEASRQFLASIGSDTPFYLHVASSDPHRSRAPDGFGHESNTGGVPEVIYDPADVVVPDFLPDVPDVRRDLASYYRAVSRWDQFVGGQLRALEESGRADETLVIVTADHAMPFPGAKASSFDSGHRCPLLIRNPRGSSGGVHSQALVNWCDFHPTIVEWCGLEQPPPAKEACDLPGRSLLPILGLANPAGWDETYFSHCFHEVTNYYPYRVLRGRRFKFVKNLAPELPCPIPSDLYRSATWQAVLRDGITMMGRRPTNTFLHQAGEVLFDLESDPAESTNVINEPRFKDVAARMRQQVLEFREATKDPWLELSFQRGEPVAKPFS